VDVWLVAATHRDLTQMIKRNEFRSGLYYRLNVFPILLPPLRERREDIVPLLMHYVDIYACKMSKRIEILHWKCWRRSSHIDGLVTSVSWSNAPSSCQMEYSRIRSRRKATLIRTNLEYEEWPRLLGNKELTEALLSRLRHQCQTIHINGPTLREPQG
jgi:sigma54-dependent transcription regulator